MLFDVFLLLPDTRGGQSFHRAEGGLEITGTADLPAQARGGVSHDFCSASTLGFGSVPGLGFGFVSVGAPGLDPPSGVDSASGLAFDLDPASGLACGLG